MALTGHDYLILDIKELLAEAQRFEYHDFKSEAATPKMNLCQRLNALATLVQRGRYDNRETED